MRIDALSPDQLSRLARAVRRVLRGADPHDPATWTPRQRAQIRALYA